MIDVGVIPPALLVGATVIPVLVCSRRVGYAAAMLGCTLVVLWALLVPVGTELTTTFIGFELRVVAIDTFSQFMLLILGGFGVAAVGYAYGAGLDQRSLLTAITYVTAATWTVTVGDWLGLVIGWELMAIASTVLLWRAGGGAIRAGYRYALAHALGGGLLLAGVLLHLQAVGISPTALHFNGTGISAGVPAVVVGLGVGVNAAVIGLHAWLPDSYHRPHVAASVFLCAYTTKVAVYAAYRAFPEGNLVLAYVGGAMAIYGAGYALAQKDMRRLLAYHIQAQVGYMLAGIGIGSALGVAGGFGHLFNNVLYKGLLFMVAGSIVLSTGENRLDRYGALGRSAPVLLGAFLVAALSITAVPGFNGFVSKGMVLDAAGEAGERPLRWVLLVGAVGTFASFSKFGYYAFLQGDPAQRASIPSSHKVVMVIIALLCVLLGLWYQFQFALLPETGTWSTDPYSTGHLIEGVTLAVVGILAFVVGKPVFDRLHGGIDVNRIHDPVVFYGTKAGTGAIARCFKTADSVVGDLAKQAIRMVRNPAETIEQLLPASYEQWYEQRRKRIPGQTGFKASLDTSLYLIVLVLLVLLTIAHL